MAGQQLFAHASNKNFGSLDDIYDSLNVAKNKYSVNQAVELIGSCKLQYLVKTRYQHNRVKKILPILLGGKIIDQCLKYYSPTNN